MDQYIYDVSEAISLFNMLPTKEQEEYINRLRKYKTGGNKDDKAGTQQ